jgi:hypothetical protein
MKILTPLAWHTTPFPCLTEDEAVASVIEQFRVMTGIELS